MSKKVKNALLEAIYAGLEDVHIVGSLKRDDGSGELYHTYVGENSKIHAVGLLEISKVRMIQNCLFGDSEKT